MPTISPWRTLQRDAAHRLEVAVVVHLQVATSSTRVARGGRLLLDPQQHLAADHEPGQALLGGPLARGTVPTALPAPQHGDPVGQLEHLAQLVA